MVNLISSTVAIMLNILYCYSTAAAVLFFFFFFFFVLWPLCFFITGQLKTFEINPPPLAPAAQAMLPSSCGFSKISSFYGISRVCSYI